MLTYANNLCKLVILLKFSEAKRVAPESVIYVALITLSIYFTEIYVVRPLTRFSPLHNVLTGVCVCVCVCVCAMHLFHCVEKSFPPLLF